MIYYYTLTGAMKIKAKTIEEGNNKIEKRLKKLNNSGIVYNIKANYYTSEYETTKKQ